MKSVDHYDVVCAGGGFSSYLTAALLSKAGKRVLLVDDQKENQSLDQGSFDSESVLFNGLSESGALAKSFAELGIPMSGFKSISAITQVLTPSDRTVFWNDSKKSYQEFQRVQQRESKELEGFFSLFYEAGKSIPSFVEDVLTPAQSSTKELADWRKYWSRYYKGIHRQKPQPLRGFLSPHTAALCENYSAAIIGSASYCVPNNLCFEQSARALSLLFQGANYHRIRSSILREKFSEVIKAHGGKVKRNSRVQALVSEFKKISGVVLSSHEGMLGAENIVLGSRIKKLYSTLPEEVQNPSIIRSLRKVVPLAWRFSFSIEVKAEVLPLGVTERMVYLKTLKGAVTQSPLFEENFISLQLIEHEDPNKAVISATVFVPYKASTFDYSYLRKLGGKVLRALTELIPFLESNIISVSPDFRNNEESIRQFYPPHSTDWVSENPLQYYVSGYKKVQDFWGPSWTTSHSNLYFTGRSIWPSLGVYGEALSARKICQDILESR